MSPWVRVAQALSLDVVLGALGGAALAVDVTGARPPAAWWVLLGLAVWTVYAADRWLDARRVGHGAHTFRHRWFARHHRWLGVQAALLVPATAAGAWLVLPRPVVPWGGALAVAVGGYLALAQARSRRLGRLKEPLAAVLYVAGIWFVPLLLAEAAGAWVPLVLALHFVAALTNLLAFSVLEIAPDRLDGHRSLARRLGADRAGALTVGLCGVAAVAALAGLAAAPGPIRPALAALLPLLLIPALIVWRRRWFARHDRYRLWGDLPFAGLAVPLVLHLATGA